MVIGEDLGTVPEGFRDRLTRAKITGMRVLWFERKGVEFVSTASYPPTSVACVATHDLATLAGWWQGADIAERLALGLLTLAKAGEAIAERREEKRALCARSPGEPHGFAGGRQSLPDATAAAVHALIGGSSSMFAHAQYDDLAGETVATNLPERIASAPTGVSSRARMSPPPSPAIGRRRSSRRWPKGGCNARGGFDGPPTEIRPKPFAPLKARLGVAAAFDGSGRAN